MKLSRHNLEQMARGYLMYQLAKRGYNVQITDSRFPTVDLLVVSPSGKYFCGLKRDDNIFIKLGCTHFFSHYYHNIRNDIDGYSIVIM